MPEFIAPLIAFDQVAASYRQWRLHRDFLTALASLVSCMTSDQIHSKFSPLLCRHISEKVCPTHAWNVYGTCMKRAWNICGTCMEHIWNMYGTCIEHMISHAAGSPARQAGSSPHTLHLYPSQQTSGTAQRTHHMDHRRFALTMTSPLT